MYVYDADAKVEVSVDVYKSRCRLIVETNIETEVHNGEAYKVVQEESIKKVLNAEMFNHGGYVAEEVRPNIPATTVYWGTLHPTMTTGGGPKYLCLLVEYYPLRLRTE